MIRRALSAVAAGTLSALTLATAAPAHEYRAAELGGGGPDGVPKAVERVLGGHVTALDSGGYRVRSDAGFSFTTHGPDFGPDMQRPFGAMDEVVTPAAERPIICATDFYQEVLYAYPTSGTNDLAANLAAIRTQIETNNAILNADSLASGGPQADYKVLCESGEIKVSAFSVPSGDATATFDEIVAAAKAAGYGENSGGVNQNTNVDYTIFYDGPGDAGACGVGYLYYGIGSGDVKSVNNPNNNPAGLEAGYGASFDGCWFGRTSMHENGHNQGAVQQEAPNSTGTGGHCNELDDVLCYVDGGSLNQSPVACPVNPGTLHFDCAYNTYFDSAPEGGEWLDTHWNIGWTGNRFIQFGGPDVTDPDTNILGGPNGPVADSTPTFSFESTELNSTFKCDIDDDTPDTDCTSPWTTPVLSDGPHTFYVAATDPATNADDTPASRSFSVDTTAPDTTIDTAPSGTITVNSALIEFSSPEVGATFVCSLDGGPLTVCTSPRQLTGLSEGSHTFQVRARDALLNTDPTPASASFTVDLPDGGGGGGGGGGGSDQTPPETTLTDTPPSKIRVKRTAKVEFGFASNEGGTFFCSLDGAGPFVCTSPQEYKGLRKGQHTFSVVAIDLAGNMDSTAATDDFTVKKKKRKKN